jgi:F0F1-type ATP synthase membrane subunit c/vacuolar-type H+-ATPase subunit K
MENRSDKKPKVPTGTGIALGAGLGVAFGSLYGQLALGLALGVAFGAALDIVSHVRHKNKD